MNKEFPVVIILQNLAEHGDERCVTLSKTDLIIPILPPPSPIKIL